jgi:hypothetical protein
LVQRLDDVIGGDAPNAVGAQRRGDAAAG